MPEPPCRILGGEGRQETPGSASWNQMGPAGARWDQMTPNGTRWDQIAPDGTTWDQMGPEDHMGPDSRRYQEAPGAKWEFTIYLQ